MHISFEKTSSALQFTSYDDRKNHTNRKFHEFSILKKEWTGAPVHPLYTENDSDYLSSSSVLTGSSISSSSKKLSSKSSKSSKSSR